MHAFKPTDHLRHPPGPDGRMRDSLFWQTVIAEERLCFQTYLFLTAEGKAGLNIALWGGEDEKYRCAEFQQGEVPATMDFDDFAFEGFKLGKVAFGGPAKVSFSGRKLKAEFEFTGLHDPSSHFAMKRKEGAGLGLVLSHQLVHLMGGQLDYRTEAGVGSSFFFTLPLRSAEKAAV